MRRDPVSPALYGERPGSAGFLLPGCSFGLTAGQRRANDRRAFASVPTVRGESRSTAAGQPAHGHRGTPASPRLGGAPAPGAGFVPRSGATTSMSEAQRVGQLFLVRHADERGDPRTVAQAIATYHFGSVLLNKTPAVGHNGWPATPRASSALATQAGTGGAPVLHRRANQEGRRGCSTCPGRASRRFRPQLSQGPAGHQHAAPARAEYWGRSARPGGRQPRPRTGHGRRPVARTSPDHNAPNPGSCGRSSTSHRPARAPPSSRA